MRCGDLEALGVAYIDDEIGQPERARVDDHLRHCPPCRERIEAERAARDTVRAARLHLREPAPARLRARCEGACRQPATNPGAPAQRRSRAVPLSLAAAALLALAVTWFGRLDAGTSVLAAQVTLDHMKCAKFNSSRVAGSPSQLAAYWRETAGWPIIVPAAIDTGDLRLSGIRRCASSEGQTAHIMYSYRGRPVSLFIAREDSPRTAQDFDLFGHETIVWSADERTYLLVGDESRQDLQAIAALIRQETLGKER
jgi:anti-sigma factor RsiW